MTQENALKVFKCLSDMSRLRIVQSLTRGEMYTELLAERLGLTPSTVSFHMKKLEDAGLVVSRRDQYYTVYSLNRDVLEQCLLMLLQLFGDCVDVRFHFAVVGFDLFCLIGASVEQRFEALLLRWVGFEVGN